MQHFKAAGSDLFSLSLSIWLFLYRLRKGFATSPQTAMFYWGKKTRPMTFTAPPAPLFPTINHARIRQKLAVEPRTQRTSLAKVAIRYCCRAHSYNNNPTVRVVLIFSIGILFTFSCGEIQKSYFCSKSESLPKASVEKYEMSRHLFYDCCLLPWQCRQWGGWQLSRKSFVTGGDGT